VLPKLAVAEHPGPCWVRTASEPLVLGGHERSTSANQDRRSEADHRLDLGRRSSPALGSNPSARSSPAPRDVAHIAGPSSGLPEIAVRALVSKRVED
jgi:hypothetical protein